MELTGDSVDESPFQKKAVSSCIPSPSFNEISALTHSKNGNPFSLFYSADISAMQPNNVIQSSRASNSWIASLRSGNQRNNLSTSALDSRQHHSDVSPKKDDSGRINTSGTAVIHVRSTSIDGRLSSSSHSFTCSSSFRHWASLESIQRNQRLKQLAVQSSTKVRSLSARESTATAERWRYIQTVLERRRKENLEHRERFIRQPLDNILRHKGPKPKRVDPPTWHSFVADRSILKRHSFNWRIKSRRHVHFEMEQLSEMADHYREGDTLPIISIPEETEETSNESLLTNEENLRLPPLITPSCGIEIIKDEHNHDDTPQRISPSGPSWVERQVAKVRQRKLWALRQQQQNNQQKHQEKLNYPMRRVMLKRSVSLLVNVPDERDTETDSLNEEEDQGNRSDCEQRDETICRKGQAWEVMLNKDEWTETPDEQIKDDPTVDSYGGWPHFPVKLAICIQQRQNNLKERKERRKEETRNGAILNPSNNSFSRRKRFGNRVSIVADRLQKRRAPKRLLSSPIRQSQVIQRSSDSNYADESDPAVCCSIPNDEDTFLTNAISSLQVLDTPNLPLPIHVDVDSAMSFKLKSNEFHAMTPSLSSPSDVISESDVTQPTLEEASVSLDSDAETIIADCQYHSDQLIEAHHDSMKTKADDENYYQSAGSANVYQKRQEITDESISDVTADDVPYRIDQQESNTMTIPRQHDDGMESRLDSIPAGISCVDKTEYHISPTVHEIDGVIGRKLSTYCSSWPGVISNKNDDAIPPSPMTTVSYWNNFEDPTSEETMTGIINQPEVDISSEATAFALLVVPATQKDSNQPPSPPVSPVIIQNSLDKKTKEARNASRILFPTVMSIPTQTEVETECGQGSKDEGKAEEGKMLNDSMDAKELDGTGAECQCIHKVVLTCLLPEAAETLSNLELIRQHLKKARIRRQGGEQQRHPLQVHRDTFSGIDPNTSTAN